MRSVFLVLAASVLLSTAAHAQSMTFVNPSGNGGYVINRPGDTSPTFANPNGRSGYDVYTPRGTPGSMSPTFVNPNGRGGYDINAPNAGTNGKPWSVYAR